MGLIWVIATLVPLAAFVVQILFGSVLKRANAYIATGAIGFSFFLSTMGMLWYASFKPGVLSPPGHHAHHEEVVEGAGAAGHADHSHDGEAGEATDHGHEDAGHDSEADHGPVNPVAFEGSISWATLIRGEDTLSKVLRENPALGDLIGPEDLREEGPGVVSVGYRIDNITALMFFMVTLIATCIHVYSMGYMDHEPRYGRFFAYLSLFCFSMLALVVSNNFFQVFMCWELVGLCSYFLIGFYYEKKSASCAANKAFITNRIGDVGFIVGLMVLFSTFGTFSFSEIFTPEGMLNPELAAKADTFWLTVAGIGIFVGCVGKSAQFPLHVWLPDAMEGPTPVSALIHAATMVAAGVYLIARSFPLFTPEALLVITYIGGITLFVAATIAIVATDIKKALAYSTVSQLGYMVMVLGIGGWIAGLMHLITHAFFKALLFLCSGSVIHGTGTQEMPQMGGLYKKMPKTALTMLVGVLCISGFPLTSGFYSKDAIIAQVLAYGESNPEHTFILLLPGISAGITAFYMFRLWFMTFVGTPRDKHVHDHAHESGDLMTVPLVILACCAFLAAGVPWLGLPIPSLESFIGFGQPAAADSGQFAGLTARAHELHGVASVVASGCALLGTVLAVAIYWKGYLSPSEAQRQFPRVYDLLINKWYFDEIYRYLAVRPAMAFGRMVAWFDKNVIDGALDGSADLTVRGSNFEGRFDLGIVDGMVNWIGSTFFETGVSLKRVQTGWLRGYVVTIALGAVALVALGAFLYTP
ncbi:NADH-quinone oxidoreductase subunit L [Planctomycetes bacterium Pan216]|uniref:NADH-quinone oxidoreductase subunit L n=1 Tax=Kolteria novifilia TaxID=2527975 RepID=A0A518B190_9BACT|nr:NADH-quinone oxidoreductase subunit L [Planctomycetes bacterium Pan216]